MKIIPKRTMWLDGRRVEAGKVENVAQKEGELAIRMGWAALPDKEEGKSGKKGAEAGKEEKEE